MDNKTALLINGIREATRFLHRDYFELENLQSSLQNTTIFCHRSIQKLIENLQSKLEKYFNKIIFNYKELNNIIYDQSIILIEPIEGISNFSRSLPYFSTIAVSIKKINNNIITERCVINFPALNEIYYAEKGKGAWVEKNITNSCGPSRIRVSNLNKLDQISIAINNIQQLNLIKKIPYSKTKCFNSYTYSTTLFCCGKIDLSIFPPDSSSYLALKLLITEAGGNVFIYKNMFIGTNYQIYDKIKELMC